MPWLTAREKQTLTLICDTFIPELEAENGDDPRLFCLKAADLNLADEVEQAIADIADENSIRELRWFLWALEIGWLNRATAKQNRPFSQLDLDERTAVLRAWGESQIPLMRKAFQAVKRLSLAIFYVAMPNGEPNPTWDIYNYALPPPIEKTPRPIVQLTINAPTTLDTDVLVIGSGAGGGVVAGELTAAGLDVIVVEKGDYYADSDFHGRERESTEKLYERRGVLTTTDLGVHLLAGSTLGGGTTINWTTSLRTPEYVLREWAVEYGFVGAESIDFQRSMDAVAQRIHVNNDESTPNALNAALERGCKALGYQVSVIPRNVKGCEDCGFCNYGCPFGAKQSTLKTYLQDAFNQGARIIVNAAVNRILQRGGVAQGAEVSVKNANGEIQNVTIRAKIVVVGAGAVHTPAILRRSGMSNAHIGSNLHIHPVTAIFSQFDEPVMGWRGAPQTRVSHQFANLDGRGYGAWIETAPVHPGLAAQAFPWHSGRMHKRNMQRLDHYSNLIILTRDYHSGRVTLDKCGEPVLHYKLSEIDARHLMHGLIEALKIHRAAGAKVIYGPHNHLQPYKDGDNFEDFLTRVRGAGCESNVIALFSAHQMSTCRIGGSSRIGAITPEGETYEMKNLYVADGSALPTAAGVNPMLSIMATAHYIAQQIKAKSLAVSR
jgi:choline dehydrogenase-like flavoprotein